MVEELEAWLVVTEDIGHDGGDSQLWQLVNDELQGPAPHSLVADRLVNVDTDLGRVFDSPP